jgi:integrase
MYVYSWAERHAIFQAASWVTLDEQSGFAFVHFLGMLMLAGLRVDEARQVHWNARTIDDKQGPWLDLSAWEIVIPDSDGRSKRIVPIIPQLASLLSRWPSPREGSLFPFRITYAKIVSCWEETVKLAGVRPVNINSLRGTYAAMMHEVFRLSSKEISKILGETSGKWRNTMPTSK